MKISGAVGLWAQAETGGPRGASVLGGILIQHTPVHGAHGLLPCTCWALEPLSNCLPELPALIDALINHWKKCSFKPVPPEEAQIFRSERVVMDLKESIYRSRALYMHGCMLSRSSSVRLCVTVWTVACQSPLSIGFSGRNTGVSCHALLQGIFPRGRTPCLSYFLHWQVGSLPLVPPGKLSFIYACMHAKSLQSCPTLCDPRTAAHQAPLSTGFSRQEYWSGLPFPSPSFIYTLC